MTSKSFSIKAATYEDVPVLARIGHEAFDVDRHTEMKAQGKVPYNMEAVNNTNLPRYLDSERCVVLKAIEESSGTIMGWLALGFRGFEKHEMPVLENAPQKEDSLGDKSGKDQKEAESSVDEKEEEEKDDRDESIKRLEAMTDADMKSWMEKLMPPGTRCMYVVGLSVAPAFQKRGVGSALLKWGTDLADTENVFIWVHSSEPAWSAYAKSGFEVIGTLDVDLDEWAVRPPSDGSGKWGHYIFRYMKYLPKRKD
ncbi:acetyltransferase [Phlyctema vagabunda]|uniref:Acetyltransferase n=1 Tax=Phlyctema vagabunda TaxID=108571 RepID=A0ABR4PSK6_9HELO